MKYLKTFGAALLLAMLIVTGSAAGGGGNSNNTPADVIHPNIHQNNGPGQNANPNGANDGGGNMHGIGNVPGQSDNDPGVANLANVHGGIGAYNKNVN